MKHFIIVKFIDGYDYRKELSNITLLFDKCLNVDGVYDYSIHISNSLRENRYDLMIEITMSYEGLVNWDNSLVHKEWKELYGKFISNKAIFDYDFEII